MNTHEREELPELGPALKTLTDTLAVLLTPRQWRMYQVGDKIGMVAEEYGRLCRAGREDVSESTAIYLRPFDVTMIGQAKHAGQDMVSVLAQLHPHEGWTVRFNVCRLSPQSGGES